METLNLALNFLVVTKGAMVSCTSQRHHQIKIDQLLRGGITSKRSQKCLPSNLRECILQLAMKCFYNTFLVGVMRFGGFALQQPSIRANDTTLKNRSQKPLTWDHQKAFKDTPLCISGLVRMQISEHLKKTTYPRNDVPLRLSVIIGFLPDIVREKICDCCLCNKWSYSILCRQTLNKMHMISGKLTLS